MRPRAVAALLVIAAAAASGCGGDDASGPVTTAGPATGAEYVNAVNAACRRFGTEKANLRALVPKDRDDVLDWLSRSSAMLDREIAAVRAIPAPEDAPRGVERGLKGLERASALFSQAHAGITSGREWKAEVARVLPRLRAVGTPAGKALGGAGLVECAT
ncbi:MAG: hypothetical protein IT200_16630 [Thermoleophilia bacterium]|nr:hypothetical protein [Thermoleophilia bacterium]